MRKIYVLIITVLLVGIVSAQSVFQVSSQNEWQDFIDESLSNDVTFNTDSLEVGITGNAVSHEILTQDADRLRMSITQNRGNTTYTLRDVDNDAIIGDTTLSGDTTGSIVQRDYNATGYYVTVEPTDSAQQSTRVDSFSFTTEIEEEQPIDYGQIASYIVVIMLMGAIIYVTIVE